LDGKVKIRNRIERTRGSDGKGLGGMGGWLMNESCNEIHFAHSIVPAINVFTLTPSLTYNQPP
jgi:hypothetical protein